MRCRHALPVLLLLPACVVQAVQPELPSTEIATTFYLMSAEGHTGWVCKRIVGPLGTGILPYKEPPDRPPTE